MFSSKAHHTLLSCAFLAPLFGLVFAPTDAPAQTTNIWTNTVSSTWTTTNNWTPNGPVSNSTNTILQFNATGVDNYTATDNFAGTFLLNRLILNSSSSLTNFLNGGALQFTAGTLGGPQLLQNGSGGFNVSNNVSLAVDTTFGGTGTGDVTLAGVVSNVGGLIKSGAFRLILTGTNTFTGTTLISGGALNVRNNSALGDSATGTTVNSGAALELEDNVTIGAEALNLTGTGVANGGALRGRDGYNTYGGAITLAGATRINADTGGTLVLDSVTPITGAGQNLTVGGSGDTMILSAIDTGSGTLTKDGTGRLILAASNSFTGAVTVSNGVLNVRNNFALSDTATGTAVRTGAALELQDGLSIGAEALTLAGTGVTNSGALRSVGGTNAYSGAITLTAAARINTDAGSALLLNSSIAIAGAGQNLTVGGSGATTILSPIATGAGTFTKDGTGALVLSGSNTYTGATVINGGALNLSGIDASLATTASVTVNARAALNFDNVSAINSNRINDATSLTLSGGTLNFSNAAGGISGISELIGTLTVGAGSSTLNAQPSAGNSLLSFSNLTRSAAGVINFTGATLGGTSNKIAFSNAPTLDDGIIGGWATVNYADFATYTNGSVTNLPAAGYNTGSPLTWGSTQNVKVTNNVTVGALLAANRIINSLNIQSTNAVTLNLSGLVITNQSGGLLVSGNARQFLTNGIITAGPNPAGLYELITIVSNGVTFTNAAVITNNGVNPVTAVFAGPGTTALRANNTYTSNTVISAGVVSINNNNNLGSTANTVNLSGDATLQIAAGITQTRTVNLGPGGGRIEVTTNNLATQSGLIGTNGQTFTKDGTGTLIVNSVNNTSRTGLNVINAGLLRYDSATATGLGSNALGVAFQVNGGTFGWNNGVIASNTIRLNGGTLAVGGGNRVFSVPVDIQGNSFFSFADVVTPTTPRNLTFSNSFTGDGFATLRSAPATGAVMTVNFIQQTNPGFAGTLDVQSNIVLLVSHTNLFNLGGTVQLEKGSQLTYRFNGLVFPGVTTNFTNVNMILSNNVVLNGDATIDARRFSIPGPGIAPATNNIVISGLTLNSANLTVTTDASNYRLRVGGPVVVNGTGIVTPSGGPGAGQVPFFIDGPLVDGTNAGVFVKAGPQNLFMTNVQESTFSGGIILSNATLIAHGGTNLATSNFVDHPLGTGPITFAGGSLDIRADASINPSNNLFLSTNGTLVVTRVSAVGGTGKTVTFGSLTLSNNAIGISGGNNAQGFIARFSGPVAYSGSAIISNNGVEVIFDSVLANTGGGLTNLAKYGTNRLFLTNLINQTYTGGTYVDQGQLRVAGSETVGLPLGTGDITLGTNAILELRSDTNQIFGPGNGYTINLAASAGVNVDRRTTNVIGNNIFQINAVNLNGFPFIVTSSNNGDYLAINSPMTLSNNNISGGGNVQFNDNITLVGSNTLGATFRFMSNAVLQGNQSINVTNTAAFNGLLVETAPGTVFTKYGGATLFFTNWVNQQWSGPTIINSGAVQVAANGITNLILGTNNIFLNNGGLNLRSPSNQIFGPGDGYAVTVSGTSTINLDRSAGSANANALLQLGQITHNGGLLTISGANTFNLRIPGPTLLNGLAGFNVTDTRSVNPFSLQLDGPITEVTPGSALIKYGTENLGITNLTPPNHSGGTFINNGVIAWRPTNLASGTYSFGTGNIRLDGGGTATFAFQQSTTLGYLLSNNFATVASLSTANGLTGAGGGTLDFTAQGAGRPLVTNIGNIRIGGPLTVTAGTVGTYGIGLSPITFVGTTTVAVANQRLMINGSGGTAGNRIVFNTPFISDGPARNLIINANNNAGVEFGGNNSGFAGAFQVQASFLGANGRVLFANTNSIPAGGVQVGDGAFVALATNFGNANISNAISRMTFGPNSVLGLTFINNLPLDLSPAGLNREVRLGAPDGFTATNLAVITPYSNTLNLGGGGGGFVVQGTNVLRDTGTPTRLSANAPTFTTPFGNTISPGGLTINQSNSFSGGTVVNSGTLVINHSNALGSGAIEVYGTLSYASGALVSFAGPGGQTNFNRLITHPNSTVVIDNANANNNNRFGDAETISLNGATFDYRGRNLPGPTGNSTEFVSNLVYGGNSRVLLTSFNLQTNTLIVSNLTRQGNGVLLVGRTTGLLGVNNRFLVGNPASVPTNNNMVAPYILNTTDQTFLNYNPDTFDTLPVGFTNVTYTTSNLNGALPTDIVDVMVGATNIIGNVTNYAMRIDSPVAATMAGLGTTITINSGGLVNSNANVTMTVQPHLSFRNSSGTPIEGIIYVNTGTLALSSINALDAATITKAGPGNLLLSSNNLAYSGGWNVQRGTLQVGTLATNGLGATTAGNTVNLNGAATLQFSGNANNLTYTGGKIISLDSNNITTDFGAASAVIQSYASGLDLNSVSNGPLGSVLTIRQSNSRNLFNILGPVTLNADTTLQLINSTFPVSGGSNRVSFAGGLVGTGRTLTKYGSGTLVLPGNNSGTFLGGTIDVRNGVVVAGNNGAFGNAASQTTFQPGTVLEFTTNVSNFLPIATVNQLPGSAERWYGELNGFSGLTNAETNIMPANVALQIANTITNPINKTIRLNGGGIEAFNWADDARANLVTLGTGITLDLASNGIIGQSGIDTGRSNMIFNLLGNITESGGSRSLTKISPDLLILAGSNSYTGGTFINSGTLRLGSSTALPVADRLAISNLAVLDLNGWDESVVSLLGSGIITNSNPTNKALTIDNATDSTFQGGLFGRIDLTKFGTGSLTLSGSGTAIGSINGYAGAFIVGASPSYGGTPLGSSNSQIVLNGPSKLLTSGPYTVPQTIKVAGNNVVGGVTPDISVFSGSITLDAPTTQFTSTNGGRVEFRGNISDLATNALAMVGGGTIVLAGSNTYLGGTSVGDPFSNDSTTLLVNNTSGSGTGTGDVTVFQHATLGGNGRIGGTLSMFWDPEIGGGGKLRPGNNGIGALRVNQNLNLAPLSFVSFEIGGLIATNDYDVVSVGGNVDWGLDDFSNPTSTLELVRTNGYWPSGSSVFTLMTFASKSGATFGNAPDGSRLSTTDNLGSFQVNYTATNLFLNQFQFTDTDGDGVYDAWALKYFAVINLGGGFAPSDLYGDADGDGLNNWQEFMAGTDPTNAQSRHEVTQAAVSGTASFSVRWRKADETTFRTPAYKLQTSSDLANWNTVTGGVVITDLGAVYEWVDDGSLTGGTPPLNLASPRYYRVLVE